MNKKHNILLVFLLLLGLSACQNEQIEKISIIPTPIHTEVLSGKYFHLDEGMVITVSDDTLLQAGDYLQKVLKPFQTQIILGSENADIRLILDDKLKLETRGYHFSINSKRIEIKAKDYSGIISGIATLRQLLPVEILNHHNKKPLTLPAIEITDYPRFSWRGLMLDSSRHFWTKEEVLRLLDIMAYYKLNKFHWHLTDDQGWRIEIKKYPLLTEKGGWRKLNSQDRFCLDNAVKQDNTDFLLPEDRIKVIDGDTIYGGYYTQNDIKEIVGYASQRGIDVIPEIDMPGHFLAAIDQYPYLTCKNMKGWGELFSSPICVGKDQAIQFCKDVYAEVFELFPYEYVHMGGDEVDKTNWKRCNDCQRRMKKEGLKSEDELQAWFVREMENYFLANGKRLIGWDEVVNDGLTNQSTIMWWRGWTPQAVPQAIEQGMQVINTQNIHLYFDYEQDKTTLEKLLNYDPVVEGLNKDQEKQIIGVQANVWTEWIPSVKRLDYMIMPRLIVLSEIAWAQKDNKMDIDRFYEELPIQAECMDFKEINYRVPDIEGFYDTNVFTDEAIVDIKKPLETAQIRYTTDGSIPNIDSPLYTEPLRITESTDFRFRTFRTDGTPSDIYKTKYIKTVLSEPQDIDDATENLKVKWYYYGGNKCAEIETAPLKGEYQTESVMIPNEAKGNIGLVINGLINIPDDGIYTFALLSDDGSMLTIDDEVVVNNDGPHSPKEVIGQKALKAGFHPIEIRYFDHNGGILNLDIITPNNERMTPTQGWFYHVK